MIYISEKRKCVGCGACVDVCRKNAISFFVDNQGFSYPEVRASMCVECGMCESVCPIRHSAEDHYNSNRIICYATWNTDDKERQLSSSGGVFSLLAKSILETDGMVCGAIWTNSLEVRHRLISSKDHLASMRKAKYIQSETLGIFSAVKQQLNNNKRVLFSGTPCQVAGLKSFLNCDYENLFTVEVICHGVVSQKVFSRYIESLERHLGSKVLSYDFRDKTNGWLNYDVCSSLNNEKSYSKIHSKDEYMLGYLWYNLYLRPACMKCEFKGFPRYADITLGDYWGVDEKEFGDENCKKGISVVILNGSKGCRLFESISDSVTKKEIKLDDVISGNPSLVESSSEGKYSSYFYKHYTEQDFLDLIHKIERKALWDRKDLTLKDRVYLIKKQLIGR